MNAHAAVRAAVTAADVPRYDGSIELEAGWRAHVRTEDDETIGAPWKEFDGHGVITDWETRDKRPSERVLTQDGGSAMYYDIAATMRVARADGWGCSDVTHIHETKGENAACAVERDYEFCKGFADGTWRYIGVIVTLRDSEGEEVVQGSVWGVEGCGEYWREVAAELINELAAGVTAETA